MLEAALDILDGGGADALTMRALAKKSEVNPMTLYHHFGDQDGLIRALSERVYARVTAPRVGSVQARLMGLLQSYQSRVVQHPGLTLAIFRRPSAFPDQARRITDDLTALLGELGLPPTRLHLWISILVDFTHGAALATAMNGRSEAEDRQDKDIRDQEYTLALTELLDALARSG